MDAVRSGMPLRTISRVIASWGRTMETTESMATEGGWFMVKYFAICAPWALACVSREFAEFRFSLRACVLLCTTILYERRPAALLNERRVLPFLLILQLVQKQGKTFGVRLSSASVDRRPVFRLDDHVPRINFMKCSIFFVTRAGSGPRFCCKQLPQKNVMMRSASNSLSPASPRAAVRLSIRSSWAFAILAIMIRRALGGRSANSRMEFTEKHPFCPQLP